MVIKSQPNELSIIFAEKEIRTLTEKKNYTWQWDRHKEKEKNEWVSEREIERKRKKHTK